MAKLSDIFTLQMGKTPARAKDEYWNNGDNNWVSISDLSTYNKYVGDTKETISDLAVKDSGIKPVPADTVIMSFKLTLGKTAITVKPTFTNEAIMAFIPNGNYPVCPSYFYHFFGGRDWSKGTNRAVMGVTLNKATLGEIDVATPSLEEQTKIAEHLDRVDELISYRKQQLSKLDELVKSRFIEMFGDISTGVYNYATRKLGDVAFVGSSHRVFTTEFVDEGIPFYRGTEIGELANGIKPFDPYYISEEHYNRLASDESKPQIGDLLMPSICNKGQVWMVDTDEPFYYKDGRVLCISADRGIYNTKYLQYFMREKTQIEYPKLGSGSTFAEFKIFLLKDIDVLTPPMEVQNQFATFVEQTDKLKFEVKEALEKLETLKKSLMQQYFG